MPKNSLFTPLTSVSAENHSWVPKQKLLEPVPPGVQREPSALCGVFHGQSSASVWLPLVSGLGDFKPPQLSFDLCSAASTPLCPPAPPNSFQQAQLGFLKIEVASYDGASPSRVCAESRLFVGPRVFLPFPFGTFWICGRQEVSEFQVSNINLCPPPRRPLVGNANQETTAFQKLPPQAWTPPTRLDTPSPSALWSPWHLLEGLDSAPSQGFPSSPWLLTCNHHMTSTRSLPKAHPLAKGPALTAAALRAPLLRMTCPSPPPHPPAPGNIRPV